MGCENPFASPFNIDNPYLNIGISKIEIFSYFEDSDFMLYLANVLINFQETNAMKATNKASAVVSGPVCGVFLPVTG
jgi:hypothetical protein